MNFKKIVLFIHRWLGFISGLVVFIVSITGCIFCFQDEIQDALYSYRKVQPQNVPYAEPSVIKAIALKDHPGATASFVYYYGKDRSAVVLADFGKESLHYIYLNPYNGKLLHTENAQYNFFITVEFIHLYLLLPPRIGKMVVGISVLIFLVLLITGIILWWPKRKSDRKRSFTIKWGARWRRVNYDLHNVLGFYAASIAIILAITGLSIAFKWVNKGIYNAANLGKKYPMEKVKPKSDTVRWAEPGKPVIDRAFRMAQQQSPFAQMFLIREPSVKADAVMVTAYAESLHYYKSDQYSFDQFNGKLLKRLPHTQKSPGMKMNAMNYDIHVGQIWGLPGKILAFTASLICASMPVTGFMVWLGKRKKPKKKGPIKDITHRKTHAGLTTH
jgi:uncharacterized iron-regulated membrane protein